MDHFYPNADIISYISITGVDNVEECSVVVYVN